MQQYIRNSVQKMSGYVPGEQPNDKGIIKLNTNENPYPPSPRVDAVLEEFDVSHLVRYPDPLCMELRKCIAALHEVDVDQVLVGNGSDEVLALCLRAFVEPESNVGYFDPSYSLYTVLAAIEDVAVSPVPLTPDFLWKMEDDYVSSLFFLACPNAPTGVAYDKQVIRDFCQCFQGVVVIDEAYADFADTDCMDLVDDYSNVLVARTLSKSYSLAGIRLGYVVGNSVLIDALYKIKDSYNVNALSQVIGLAALQDRQYFLKTVCKVKQTRARVGDELKAMGFRMSDSQANFLWVTPPDGLCAESLFKLLKAKRIYTRYFPGERTGAYLRISVGTDEEMGELLNAIRAILHERRQ